MTRARVVYGILWLLTLIAYSVPWASIDGETYIGWNFTVPFSITYLIGLLLGLIVLTVKYKPVGLTIVAGVLMILGVIGGFIGFGILEITAELAEPVEVTTEPGIGLAFLFALIFLVAGAATAKRL